MAPAVESIERALSAASPDREYASHRPWQCVLARRTLRALSGPSSTNSNSEYPLTAVISFKPPPSARRRNPRPPPETHGVSAAANREHRVIAGWPGEQP